MLLFYIKSKGEFSSLSLSYTDHLSLIISYSSNIKIDPCVDDMATD